MIETGTHHGDMIAAVKDDFKTIYSIELDDVLFNEVKGKFGDLDHVKLLNGDSSVLLSKVLSEIHFPCLFWLDAHYCGENTSRGKLDTPILLELKCILEHSAAEHVILIDDARDFKMDSEYPTIEELKILISRYPRKRQLEVKDDIIRIFPI